ncbi:MAG: prepilin-type N-terminal cleavage/methylation domain-containing protein [Bryobacteraceae bacterium]|nr:prepilin-type N-terminal cleavage/methylation domain-containing protein [Bryobacteraceae bacterium]MDW8378898.1 prepilin-type N-terminal cleavage/methylation domain-containing protein [Bryobacterales bacterium]
MPILSAGKASSGPALPARQGQTPPPSRESGITLIEMLVVVTLVGLMVSVSFPAVSSGLDSLRLISAADAVASFLNAALNRAERRQEVMEVSILTAENKLVLRSSEAKFLRELSLPPGVVIETVLPEVPLAEDSPRRIFLYPGGAAPQISIELKNRRNARKRVQLDPMTGAPQIENLTPEK